ncbi:hypothetical protein PRIPAC_87589 [Pristionchus pacificus]|uniref:Chromo domain-containing protein n=1 Tax=Pristionchus pacificus TaxID=54126 RepID=A0A2A6CYM9_PRIPA|nr:hypothetical protein PRIPAC_87589 [Pristionchus pacificus]|eukprot:PDM83167.1 hypothetical protein PRIPAC_37560 [Pristionchus pacificus]
MHLHCSCQPLTGNLISRSEMPSTPAKKISPKEARQVDDGEALYDVEKIQKKRVTVDGKEEFLVKWVGYKKPTWEPRDNLDSTNFFLVEFEKKLAASGKPTRVYTPRKSIGTSTPLRAAAGSAKKNTPKTVSSAKNTPANTSTSNRPMRARLTTVSTQERQAALAKARKEEKEASDDETDEEEDEEDEIVPVETRRVQKRQRVVVEEEEEQGEEMQRQVQKRPRQLLEEVEAAGKWCRFM